MCGSPDLLRLYTNYCEVISYGSLSDIEFTQEPDLLDMSGSEFQFICRRLNVPQSRGIEKGRKDEEKYMSQTSVNHLEGQVKINPAAVREFMLGKTVGLIKTLCE